MPSSIPDLVVHGPVVRKGSNGEDGYSGFSMRDPVTGETSSTELEGILREAGVERIVIAGLATDYCVVATALDARRLGFETTVVSEAISAVDLASGDGDRAIERMREAGVAVVRSVSDAEGVGPSRRPRPGEAAAGSGAEH